MTDIKQFADTGFVFTAISQYCCAHRFGNKVVMYPPHPDAPGGNKATFTEVPIEGEPNIHPDVHKTLRAMAQMAWAVGTGEVVFVEYLPVEGDDKAKFTVTIRKERSNDRRL